MATNRSATRTDAVAASAATLVRRPVTSVEFSKLSAPTNKLCSAPVLVPPSTSKAERASPAQTSTAHWRRASDSKPWASSTTQWRTGGKMRPSAATLRNNSEWLVTTTSDAAARRRAPCSRHSRGKYGQRFFKQSPELIVSILRGT